MGNIGPSRQRYEVLAVPAFGIADADLWTAPARATPPEPWPVAPEREPDAPTVDETTSRPVGWLARAARVLR